MSEYNPFIAAVPVWEKGTETEKNITIGIHTRIRTSAKYVTLRVATSGFYRVFVDGEFVFYGPTRCAHGFFRVDEIPLTIYNSTAHIAIEVVNYYVNAFGYIRQAGFIQAEVVKGERVFAATGTNKFAAFRLNERVQKVQRYSYQRPFAESYIMSPDYSVWRIGKASTTAESIEMEMTMSKKLVERRIPLNKFPMSTVVLRESRGKIKSGIKPKSYIKDRSLTGILNKEHGSIEGFFEDELSQHLSDEIQELSVIQLSTDAAPYTESSYLNEGDFEVLSLACEKTGFITLNINCYKAGVLYLLFDEILLKNGDLDPLRMECCNAVRLELGVGKYSFKTMEPYGFKYIKPVCVNGVFELKNIAVQELICPQEFCGEYNGNDQKLAKIFNAAKETFMQNSSDLLMDCPTRERAAWLCDSFFTARVEWEFTKSNVIETNFLENYLLPDEFPCIPKGMVPMCYPADHSDGNFIPNWAMWLVLQLADRLRRVGDRDFIEAFRARVYDLLNWFSKYENADGLLEKLPGWVFLEWSKANDFVYDINFPSNMLYAMMLEEVAYMYDETELYKKAAKLKELIRLRSFDGTFFCDNEIYKNGVLVSSGERTETCQYYAFFTGVATPEMYPELWNTLIKDFGPQRKQNGVYKDIYPANAFIGNFLRLMLLEKAGLYKQLESEIKGYFSYMAEHTGTLWEHISTTASCNHGFASYVSHFINEVEKHNS